MSKFVKFLLPVHNHKLIYLQYFSGLWNLKRGISQIWGHRTQLSIIVRIWVNVGLANNHWNVFEILKVTNRRSNSYRSAFHSIFNLSSFQIKFLFTNFPWSFFNLEDDHLLIAWNSVFAARQLADATIKSTMIQPRCSVTLKPNQFLVVVSFVCTVVN